MAKNIGKYSQKLLNSANKSTTNTIKTASKRAIKKTAEATDDLIGNKIADEITKASSQISLNAAKAENTELNKEIPKERYISPQKRQQIIDELRYVQ